MIEVGTGATELGWSDRHPYTVVEIVSDRELVVQADNAKRIDNNGMSECQEYEYSPNPHAARVHITLRKSGQWIQKGVRTNGAGSRFSIGNRNKYYDYSF